MEKTLRFDLENIKALDSLWFPRRKLFSLFQLVEYIPYTIRSRPLEVGSNTRPTIDAAASDMGSGGAFSSSSSPFEVPSNLYSAGFLYGKREWEGRSRGWNFVVPRSCSALGTQAYWGQKFCTWVKVLTPQAWKKTKKSAGFGAKSDVLIVCHLFLIYSSASRKSKQRLHKRKR